MREARVAQWIMEGPCRNLPGKLMAAEALRKFPGLGMIEFGRALQIVREMRCADEAEKQLMPAYMKVGR